MNTHSALAVANYILDKAKAKGAALTPMQVLKLVYLCHGWMLALHNRPLIKESVEAWQYGPVIRSLYKAVKQFRSSPVEGPLACALEEFDAEEQNIMDQVFDIYGGFSGPALSRLTHQQGTPWHTTWSEGYANGTISTDLIASHFKHLAATRSQAKAAS